MLVKKLTSSPSIMSYPPLFVASRNTMFSSLVETWMPKFSKNVNHKFSLHNSSKRNEEHRTDFTLENILTCLNKEFQKREGKLLTYPNANNTNAQINYVFINKKWKSSAFELWGLFLFRGCVLWSLNCHGKDTTEPRKEYGPNNNHCTLWLVPA